MLTTRATTKQKVIFFIAILVLIAIVAGVGLLLREYGPGNMGNGFLGGALVGLAAFSIVVWRAARRPQEATSFERAWTQTGDERDDAVLTRALAMLGLLAFPMTAAAAITIALGTDVSMVLFLLLAAEAAVLAVAFIVINRRS